MMTFTDTTEATSTDSTSCGCPLEEGPCTFHRDGDGHRHCLTCGVPVFIDEVYEDGHVEFDDHRCPPGFLLDPVTR